jgi:hypothetical protein
MLLVIDVICSCFRIICLRHHNFLSERDLILNSHFFHIWDIKIVICGSGPQSASFSPESQFSGRGAAEVSKQARTIGTFWQRCTLHFLSDRTNYKAKDIIGKIRNVFCMYLFQIDKFINTYYNFFIVFDICLPTKIEMYLLFAIQICRFRC